MPLIKARSSSIMDSVDLRGQPTSETAAQTVNNNQLASTAYVRTALADLVDSAPGILDTLNELAAAINDDANFATTVADNIATKVPLDGSVAMTGELTLSGTPTQNLSATTKQYVDDLINDQMIYSTDDVTEGTNNLYYTDARVHSAVSLISDNTNVLDYDQSSGQFTYNHPNSNGILEGSTNLYFTTARARASISMNSDDGQIISYSSSTGEITFTTPDTDKIVEGQTNLYFTTARARASVNNGNNIDYDSSSGTISTQAAVWSVNSQTHDVVLDTDDIGEGSTNLYFTNARAAGAVSLTTDDSNILSYSSGTGVFTWVTPSTDAIDEGDNNLYYTDARVRAAVSASGDISYNDATGNFSYTTPTTDGVNEGTTNKYYTDTRARNAVSLSSDNTDVLSYDNTTGLFTFSLGSQTTDDVQEGDLNLYFTDARARLAIDVAGWSNLSYNDSTGIITISAPSTADVTEDSGYLYFTTARAQQSVSAIHSAGDGDLTYDNTTGVFDYVGPTSTDYRQAVSANHVSGDGNLQYNSTSGVFSYDGPTNTDYRQAVSAYRDSGDGDLQYNSSTGVFTYTGPSAAETRVHFSASTSGTGFGDLTYDDTTGVFTYAKVTSSDVRGELSATTTGTGHGDLQYNSSTGVFTLTKVSVADVRGDISGDSASGVDYNSTSGVIGLANIPNSSLTNSDVTVNSHTISLGGSYTLDTDDIGEGTTNKYWTETRFDNALATKTTDDVAEGDNNLYWTETRFDTSFDAKDTSDLTEDPSATVTSGTMYFTQARARDTLSGGTGVTYTSSTGVIEIGQAVGTTDNVTFNDVTVSGDLTVSGTLTSINSVDLTVTDKNITIADGAADAAAADGAGITVDGANATITYASGDDSWNFNKDVNITGGLTLTADLSAPNFTGNLTGDVDAVNVTVSSLTDTRVVFAGAGGDLVDDADMTFDTATNTLSVTNVSATDVSTSTASVSSLTSGRVVLASTGGELTDSSGLSFASGILTSTAGFSGDLTGDVTGDVTGNLTGDVTGTVSDISNHTTDELDEGTTNLYYTASRVRGELSAVDAGGDGSFSYDSGTGEFTYTGPSDSETRAHFSATTSGTGFGGLSYSSSTGVFTYAKVTSADIRGEVSATKVSGDGNFSYDSATGTFSYTGPDDVDYRLAISATKVSGDGNLTYDDTTGVISYTGPSAADTRAHFSATSNTGITYTQSTGVFELASIPNSSLTNSKVTVNGYDISLGGSQTLDTDDIGEGSTNQYFLDSRARSAISLTSSDLTVLDYNSSTGEFTFDLGGISTDEVDEGTTNLYFTTARARESISTSGWSNLSYDDSTGVITINAPSTADVTENSSYLYFTNTRARQAVSLTTDNTDAMSYDNTTGIFTFTLATVNTDEIAEGSTNKYFTTARARDTINNGANIDYDASTGTISTQAAVWTVNGQDHDVVLGTDDVNEGSTNLYFTDVRAQNALTLVTDDSNILSYATGTFTFTTPTTDSIDEGDVNLYYTDTRADDRIAAASIRDLSDVNKTEALQDGYTLVWSSLLGEFVPQNVAVTATTLNFTGDGTETSFSTGVEVTSIDNTQVYINGLIQAPTYSYTINTVSNVTSIVFDTAPEANDYIFVRVSSTASLTAGGVLNESSNIDGGTY